MKVKELSNLHVQRVDLVDRAAVRDPDRPDQPTRFLVWKAENAPSDEEGTPEEEAAEGPQAEEIEGRKKKPAEKAEMSTGGKNDLPDSAFAVIKPGGSKDEDDNTTPRDLRMLPHHTADGGVDLPHLRNALARVQQEGTQLTPEQRKAALSHLQSHAKDKGVGESAEDTNKSAQGGLVVANEDGQPEMVSKADFEAVVKRAEEAERIAKEERDTRQRAELVAKAERDYKHLPGTAKEKGDTLFELSKSASPELFAKVETIFKSAEEMATNSALFTQIGSASQSNGVGSAYSEIEAKAQELRKTDPKMSEAQAIAKAASDNPELYRRYQQENPIHTASN
jgi:hypothetical protein